MKDPIVIEPAGIRRKVFSPAIVVIIAVAAIAASYVLAVMELGVEAKTRGFSVIIAVFLGVTVLLHLAQSRRQPTTPPESADPSNIEGDLADLEDARDLFSGALSAGDTFRLAANRIRALVPCRTVVLFTYDEAADRLRVTHADGADANEYLGVSISPREGQPGECYCTKQVQVGTGSIAIPLESERAAFGVLQLFLDNALGPQKSQVSTFEAIGTRIGPLLMSAVAFEQSKARAMTDATTELPNERAFFMVLENHIAESQRRREERPLTVLALDVRGFDEINRQFGHAAGDRVLAFVADVVKENLRQMDFFARSSADEFLAVLPTANKDISHEIIARVHTGFFGRKLRLNETDAVEVEINIGWAAFGSDGETPANLLAAARERKAQAKSMVPPNVLWFPSEMAS
jgi:diguanylate cyclase (GGDEF)-like protein